MENALDDALDLFGLSDPELLADTGIAAVWRVVDGTGSARVLKLYHKPTMGNEIAGVALMEQWAARAPDSCVAILAVLPNALVMDHLPGRLLGDLSREGRDLEACRILGSLARVLHGVPVPPLDELVPLESVCTALFDLRFAPGCPAELRQNMGRASAMGQDLLASANKMQPLHGDLHHDNVILGDTAKIIDAKGYIGDPCFELANAMRNPKGLEAQLSDQGFLQSRLRVLAEAQGIDASRLAAWSAVKTALSIAWRSKGLLETDSEADLLGHMLSLAESQGALALGSV